MVYHILYILNYYCIKIYLSKFRETNKETAGNKCSVAAPADVFFSMFFNLRFKTSKHMPFRKKEKLLCSTVCKNHFVEEKTCGQVDHK